MVASSGMPRPLVLVSASLASPLVSPTISAVMAAQTGNAMARLADLGALTRFVDAAAPDLCADQMITHGVAGLLVLGGADIDPLLYGQTVTTDTIYGVNRSADEHEAALIASAIQSGLPVLGICRGMQLINVVHGGTLLQDLGQPTMHNASSENGIMSRHDIKVVSGTHLARSNGCAVHNILSGHHQAIDRLGGGLRPAAHATDDVLEAVERLEAPWVVGVQWHPEDPDASPGDLDRLLTAFMRACREANAA